MKSNTVTNIKPVTPADIAKAMKNWKRIEYRPADVLDELRKAPHGAVRISYSTPRRLGNVRHMFKKLDSEVEVMSDGSPEIHSSGRKVFTDFIIVYKTYIPKE